MASEPLKFAAPPDGQTGGVDVQSRLHLLLLVGLSCDGPQRLHDLYR
jgi:hypothetical protein